MREFLGKAFLYLISCVFGLTLMTRLSMLGIPFSVSVVGGLLLGAIVGRFLTHEN